MRISREMMWMEMAEIAAMRSTCYRANVGAVIVKDRDAVSIGYNGAPPNCDHCLGNDCPLSATGSCLRATHAERNAITRAMAKLGQPELRGCSLYCTYAPCLPCSQLIVDSKIKNVFFRYPYRVMQGVEHYLEDPTNELRRITPSGIIIDARSGKILDS